MSFASPRPQAPAETAEDGRTTPQATPRAGSMTPRGGSMSGMTPRSRNRNSMMMGTRHNSMMGLSTMHSAPKWTLMGRRTNSVGKRHESRPDPGTYLSMDPAVTSKMSKSPKASFGSLDTGRLTTEKERVPGPGAYTPAPEGVIANSTSALIYSGPSREQRPRGQSRESTPDPGHYGITEVTNTSKMSRNPSYGFASSRADRFPQLKDRAPGPGSYQHKESLGDAASGKFLGSPRNPERRRGESPDPGSYLARDPSTTSKMTNSPRAAFGALDTGRTNFGKETTPGPGSYTHREVLSDQTTSFGTSERKGLKQTTEVPPPGNYNSVDPTTTSKMTKQTGYGWGSSDTGRFWAEETLRAKVNGSSTKALGSPRSPRGNTPGPGSYNVVDYQGYPKGSAVRGFGTDSRPSLATHTRGGVANPGPGTYSKGTSVGEGPKFSMRSRSVDRMKSTPGPGAYGGSWTQFD